MKTALAETLEYRLGRIDQAKDYLQRTEALFEEFGSPQLKTLKASFANLLKGLEASDVRMVVIGEFSRGKSSLVNALLDIQLLPTAQESTTAINTFVSALPEGKSERFIRVHFQDDRSPPRDINWADDSALRAWGTELDISKADARKDVDHIRVFTSHPLLDKGLVLIDTPGLETIHKHHEEITHSAINEAHIALYIMDAGQLGGTAKEWEFLETSVSKNFHKFMTVVNKWDLVLEPEDTQDKKTPETVRTRQKLETVKRNFGKQLKTLKENELELMTNGDHLMGVSARWAQSADPDKRARSGIDKLAQRIADMLTSGDAAEEIFRKPLWQLSHIQCQLSSSVTEELKQLASSSSEAERARDIETLDLEIRTLEQGAKNATLEARQEHERAAANIARNIEKELIVPLSEIKAEIECQVTRVYVEKSINKKRGKIGLPENLTTDFAKVSSEVADRWASQKKELLKQLADLRSDYAEKMQKHAGHLGDSLGQMDIEVPSLEVAFELDLSGIEEHHARSLALEQSISARSDQIEELEDEKRANPAKIAELQIAQQNVQRAERQLEQLGGQPAPMTRNRRQKVSSGGMYSSDKYDDVSYTDSSNVEAWKANRERYESMVNDKESRLAAIQEESMRRDKIVMSLEAAQRKYQKELEKLTREQESTNRMLADERNALIDNTLQRLISSTAGQLEQRIKYLQSKVKESIHTLFTDQVQLLEKCVQEQYIEPLNAKRLQREEVLDLMQKGKDFVAQRQTALTRALQDIEELSALTSATQSN